MQASARGAELKEVRNATHEIKPGNVIAFITVRNEMPRIPYFLEYYRRLGVGHFIFVDNDSTDGFTDYAIEQPDCSVWTTSASYKNASFGMDWINHLLHRYGIGHWCLTVDPDEILVFPFSESRNLHELTEFLDSEQMDHMFCVLLDMYPATRASLTHCAAGQNPLEVAPYFDASGYVQSASGSLGETWIQGGPRRRLFSSKEPDKAPALNKTPLVRWDARNYYTSSTHMLNRREVNVPHPAEPLSVTGCLLHFKFVAALKDKAEEEMIRQQHYDNSAEYAKYSALIGADKDVLFYEKSLMYEDTRQLVALGFMCQGRWF